MSKDTPLHEPPPGRAHQDRPLHSKERALLAFLRRFQFGTIRLVVRDGLPEYAEEPLKRVNFE